jgi:hypothetical protein
MKMPTTSRSIWLGALVLLGALGNADAQVAEACNAGGPRAGSAAIALHPSRVQARYGEVIAARRWMDVLRSLQRDIGTTFDSLERNPGSAGFGPLNRTFRDALESVLDTLPRILEADLASRARLLHSHAFLQFEPFQDMGGSWRVLQNDSASRPLGVIVSDSLRANEYEAICWAGRSVSRLLGGVNFETVPGALARIGEMAREWERYRSNGPDQLIHELVLNRMLRRWVAGSGEARFHPARVDLVALHPFAGVELTRRDNSMKEGESLSIETGGVTFWFNGWKQHVGASWILAYDSEGRIGRGPLFRVTTLATAGVLWRRDAAGVRRKSLLLTVDLLRVLKSDETAQAMQQTRAIVGKLLDNPLGSRR